MQNFFGLKFLFFIFFVRLSIQFVQELSKSQQEIENILKNDNNDDLSQFLAEIGKLNNHLEFYLILQQEKNNEKSNMFKHLEQLTFGEEISELSIFQMIDCIKSLEDKTCVLNAELFNLYEKLKLCYFYDKLKNKYQFSEKFLPDKICEKHVLVQPEFSSEDDKKLFSDFEIIFVKTFCNYYHSVAKSQIEYLLNNSVADTSLSDSKNRHNQYLEEIKEKNIYLEKLDLELKYLKKKHATKSPELHLNKGKATVDSEIFLAEKNTG